MARNRLVTLQDVLQSRNVRTLRMCSLLGLFKLLRISEQHHACRPLGRGENIREGHLARFVHEKHIGCCLCIRSRPEPLSSTDDVGSPVAEPGERFSVVCELLDGGRWIALGCHLVDTGHRKAELASRFHSGVKKGSDRLVADGGDSDASTLAY